MGAVAHETWTRGKAQVPTKAVVHDRQRMLEERGIRLKLEGPGDRVESALQLSGARPLLCPTSSLRLCAKTGRDNPTRESVPEPPAILNGTDSVSLEVSRLKRFRVDKDAMIDGAHCAVRDDPGDHGDAPRSNVDRDLDRPLTSWSVNVGASPVAVHSTRASLSSASCQAANSAKARSSMPSSENGVARATIDPENI